MTLLLDAGAFIALERGEQRVEFAIRQQHSRGEVPRTHGGIVGQVWRSARQVRVARVLRGVDTVPITLGLGRDAGRLLARSGTSDVIDAALVALAEDGDVIVTSDPGDIGLLVVTAGVDVTVLAL